MARAGSRYALKRTPDCLVECSMDTVANERRGRSSEDIMFIEINPAHNREGQTIQPPRQSHRPEPMPAGAYLKFRNDRGVREICIGVKEFKCIGESPAQDHPPSTSTWAKRTRSSVPTAGRGSASIRD